MFAQPLKSLEERHIIALCSGQTQESNKIEFKRELNLSDRSEKAEAAKDASAMANSDGGRIFYGIEEQKLSDGTTVASAIRPLTDGALRERLENVLVDCIHPRPRYETWPVPVQGGHVLVVEVFPSYSRDLHMVTGLKEHRFYRRGECRTILMFESEVREAYARVAASRYAIEEDMQRTITRGLDLARGATHSVFVVPYFGRPNLIDPRQFGPSFGFDLTNAGICEGDMRTLFAQIQVVSSGYECVLPERGENATDVIGIYRNGVVHLAERGDVRCVPDSSDRYLILPSIAELPATAMLLARHVLSLSNYWGPVRMCHVLRIGTPVFTVAGDRLNPLERNRGPRPPGEYRHEVYEVNLDNPVEMCAAAVDLVDQLFQMAGHPCCPWFDGSRRRVPNARLPRDLDRLLVST